MKFEELKVGDKFTHKNKIYTKMNDMGKFLGICNAQDEDENWILFPMKMEVKRKEE